MAYQEGDRTEVDAVAELAQRPNIVRVDRGSVDMVALPPGWHSETKDHEQLDDHPFRPRGEIVVHDADSFVASVQRRADVEFMNSPVIYADEDSSSLVAVLNDDEAFVAGWRDYRVRLALRRTPEWAHWKKLDGQLVKQETFAEHIEGGLNELRSPSAADMLDLAQTFHASTAATFKGGQRLASGARQFRYEETIDASAGTAGTLEVPERLILAVVPFYGAARFEVGAWFRFRLSRDSFTLGYKLDRPHEIERSAFRDVRDAVDTALPSAGVIAGPAPAMTT